MDPATPTPTNSDFPTPEYGGSQAAKPTPSYKSILTKKQYKRRRMYKLAWKMLLTNIEETEENDDSSGGSDDLFDESDEEDARIPPTTAADGTMDKNSVAEEDRNSPNKVAYRAEFYQYVRTSNREQKPQFKRSREDKEPIPTTQATQISSKARGSSIFEVTTMYAIPKGKEITPKPFLSTEVLAEVGTYITIRSKMILDTLQEIAAYYPKLSYQNDELIVQEPFCVLLHYHREILRRRDDLKAAALKADPEDDSARFVEHEHLTYLSDFIHQRSSDSVSRELARYRESRAMCTYDWVWLLFKPGTVVYAWEEGTLTAYVVEYHSRETIQSQDKKIRPQTISNLDELERKPRPDSLKVGLWNLDFDGETIGRRRYTKLIQSFEGEKSIISLPVFPKEYLKHDKKFDGNLSTVDKLVRRGKLFFEMTKRSYMQYDGDTLAFPKRTVSPAV